MRPILSLRGWPWLGRLLLLGLLQIVPISSASAALLVGNLRCDRQENPCGIDGQRPRLSWQLVNPERGARQTAWQVQVASSLAGLEGDEADLWDSGRMTGATQLDVAYAGKPLQTAATVYWRVRAWDAAEIVSSWSPVGTWTMGVVADADWKAQWITDPELLLTTREKLGFSTPPTRDEKAAPWVVLDLGQVYPIESVVLLALVHTVPERLGFPSSYKLESANDPQFADAHLVTDSTKTPPKPWSNRLTIPVPEISARYIRLSCPQLTLREEEGTDAPVGRLALRQIVVLSKGRNVAVGAKVTASASIEDQQWSATALVDGKEIPGITPRLADTLLLRREFPTQVNLKRAMLFVTGLGTYTVALDGHELGADELLKPAWTDPAKTCLYDTYDVTAPLQRGMNHSLGLTLAGGMHNVPSIPGRYTKFVSAPRALVAYAQLRLEYADNSVEWVTTDAQWRVTAGPTIFAHVYGGEDYDARREPRDWTKPGFDDRTWRQAAIAPAPGGALRGSSEAGAPIRATATLTPLTISTLQPGTVVYDLGQNASIMPRLKVRGPAGSMIKISPAELLQSDGSIDPGSTRPAQDDASWNYTLAGSGVTETWVPKFFYHGARYLQVQCRAPEGAELPVVESLEAAVVNADAGNIGQFSCSNELFNRIATLVRWAQRSNLAHVLTDCPHRERLGWLEQYHLNGPALRYNHDLARTFGKGFNDMIESQHANGLVPDIAPEYVHFDGGFVDSPEWGSALILAGWQQYVWTGAESELRRNYPAMQRYFEYLTSRARDHILSYGLGDWYDLGPRPPGVAQLTPIALTATAIYYEDARALHQIATCLGRTEDAANYANAAKEIAAAFNGRFFDSAKSTYATGSQTANAMPLVLGLVAEADRPLVAQHLLEDVAAHQDSLTAGDVGYRYLLRALSEIGRSDVVFAINAQTQRPGYGYQLAKGATSLTEAWDTNRHSSQNHFMLGQITEWFYGDLAGLLPDPDVPGFGHIIVRPTPVGNVTWAQVSYDSPRGPIAVRWRKSGEHFVLDITIPANVRAQVELPAAPDATLLEGGRPIAEVPGIDARSRNTDRAIFEIGSGHYEFTVIH